MRKAIIELNESSGTAALLAGGLGSGRCLLIVDLLVHSQETPTQERWLKALNRCELKAEELKYEVVRIRGASLAGK